MGELVKALDAFDLGEVPNDPVLAARGAMGEVYRVTTARGAFAVKRLFDWNTGEGAAADAEFTALARDRGVVTPVAIPTCDGAFVADTVAGRLRAFTWPDVGPVTSPPGTRTTLSDLGRIMALLHDIAPVSTAEVDEW